jgi:hypothetical protein
VDLSFPIGKVSLVFIILAMVFIVVLAIYFAINYRNIVVRRASPVFLELILLGLLLCSLSLLFWSINQSTATCILKIWLLAIGFGLIMG